MSGPIAVERAAFFTVNKQGKNGRQILQVMFNPASLTYTVSNTMKEQGKEKKQYVSKSTAKLTMDLIFDTTDTGTDVRDVTAALVNLMGPKSKKSKGAYQPQVIAFDWGAFRFKGMLEQYKETIDFFAPEGVPLRCSVNISLSSQDKVFEADPEAGNPKHMAEEQPLVDVGEGQDVDDIAAQAGGDPRGTAAANGIENPRRPEIGVLALGAAVQLSPPTAFTSGGLSLSASAGLGLDLSAAASAGFGASLGAGLDVSAGAELGITAGIAARGVGAIGGTSSAGVSAITGAFAGLHSSLPALPRISVDIDAVRESASALVSAVGDTTGFNVGGRASVDGASGLSADVGATATLRVGISFDE